MSDLFGNHIHFFFLFFLFFFFFFFFFFHDAGQIVSFERKLDILDNSVEKNAKPTLCWATIHALVLLSN